MYERRNKKLKPVINLVQKNTEMYTHITVLLTSLGGSNGGTI